MATINSRDPALISDDLRDALVGFLLTTDHRLLTTDCPFFGHFCLSSVREALGYLKFSKVLVWQTACFCRTREGTRRPFHKAAVFHELMKALNLLIGHSDRSICNLIEVLILDLCYNRASVNATRAGRIDDLAHKACREDFDMMIFAPENLLPAPGLELCPQRIIEAVRQIRKVRTPRKMPIIAFSVSPEQEFYLTEAGADCVLGLPFHPDELKAAVELRLNLPPARPERSVPEESFAGALMRGFQKLTTMW